MSQTEQILAVRPRSPEIQRIATILAGTDAAVVQYDGGGRICSSIVSVGDFYDKYAIPALNTMPALSACGEVRMEHSLPGVTACVLPSTQRRNGQTGLVLLGRRADFDANTEDVQRLCGRLAIDNRWLQNIANTVKPIDPITLHSLGMLSASLLRAEARNTLVERDIECLSTQLSDTYEELTLIYQISSGMRVNRSVEDFFLHACMEVTDVMAVRSAGYVVVDANGRVASSEVFGEAPLPPEMAELLTTVLLRRFGTNPKPIMTNDLASDAELAPLASVAKGMVAVAIQRQDRILGAIFCLDKANLDFTTQDSKLLNSIANETAIYLENAALFSDARGLMMGLLHALTSAVDAKDAYTCGHSQRVALFGREIAHAAGLPEALCERVYMAGLLHDVGKIGVPEEVLRKPGKLTAEEFAEMKKHVDIGARILRDVRQVDDLIPGVLYHHERYDGKGYPHGLAGQDIPLIGRILCVADSFDAMTSNRTYRKALPLEVALMEIRRCAGTQFDPMLADAWLSVGAARIQEMANSVTEKMSIRLAA
jgi:HD-GYP domain-containing protein (c-di-GMP phosphodiesterase class II)